MSQDRKIVVVEKRVGDLHFGFGNPRKVTRKKLEELETSLEEFGDFGLIVIDEDDNVLCGNQRVTVMQRSDPDQVVLCKQLIGYTESEKKAINIKDNTHAGEWNLDMLADWTSDMVVALGIDSKAKNPEDRKINDMELIRYEKYDYVMIVCRNEVDYVNLQSLLGLTDKRVLIAQKRRIKARAIWFDDIKAQIIPKEDVK